MPTGIISRLPDLAAVLAFGNNAETGTASLIGSLEGAQTGQSGSPLAPLANVLGGIRGRVNVDVSGLNQLSGTFQTIQNAVPEGMIDSFQGAATAFAGARDLLQNSPLTTAITQGQSLEQTAFAFVETGLQALQSRQLELGTRLISADTLRTVTEAFQSFDRFSTNFSNHQADFLPFLSQHLIGVAPDLLRSSLGQLDSSLAVYDRLRPASIESSVGAAGGELTQRIKTLFETVNTFDPADTAAYAQLETLLQGIEAAMNSLRGAGNTLYGQLQQAVNGHAWDNILFGLETGLRAITIEQPFSVDELVIGLRAALNELILRLQTMFGPQDVVKRIQALSTTIRDTFQNSPLGEVRRVLREFLDRIREAVEAVPLEEVQRTAEEMLVRVRQEIEATGLDNIGETIERAFNEAELFITSNINQELRDNVRSALRQLQETLRNLPFQDLSNALSTAMTQLRDLITELEGALAGAMESVSSFLAQLESLSFAPVADAVIEEIDGIKQQLAQINPNALSEIEKTALRTALSVLTALDLETEIINGLKTAFAAAGTELRRLLDELGAVLDRLRQQLDQYQPRQLLASVTDVLNRAMELAENVNGRLLLRPLYDQLDLVVRELQSISPGVILTPLEQPFQVVMDAVSRLDPANWMGPLNEFHEAVDRLLNFIDVTPLLTELDNRRRALLLEAKRAILNALDALQVPEPIAGFLATLRPFVDAITDALFVNLDTELPRIATRMRSDLRLSTLFAPLDAVFDRFLQMVQRVPAQALTEAMNTLREAFVLGLERLNPQNITNAFRAGLQQAEGLAPQILFAPALSLPTIAATFELKVSAVASPPAGAAAVRARFNGLLRFSAPDPNSALSLLRAQHEALISSLRQRINSLDLHGVETAYANLNSSAQRLLPDFLRQREPLVPDQIIQGLAALRPSRQARVLDDLINEFLNKLEPLNAAIEEPTNAFFQSLRDVIDLLNPLALRDSVASIYEAIRQKLRAIDPAELAQLFRTNVYEPIRNMLGQLDPARLRERLDQAFQRVLTAITTSVRLILDDIRGIVDEELQVIRQLLRQFIADLTAAIETALHAVEDILQRIENLVFVELLERLRRILDNLQASFNRELDRVRNAFDAMLAAIPLGDARASVSVGATA